MRDLNRVTIIGNLTDDPEVKQTTTGKTVANFSVATNRSWRNKAGEQQEAVEYVNCVAWGRLAEIVGQILRKGSRLYLEGRMQTRSWEGQDGVTRYRTEVVVSDFSSFGQAGRGQRPDTADTNFSDDSTYEKGMDQTQKETSSTPADNTETANTNDTEKEAANTDQDESTEEVTEEDIPDTDQDEEIDIDNIPF